MKSRFDPYRLPYAPRPKQKQAFSHIDKGYNTAVILPTGYGKTNIALYAFQDAADHNRKFLMLLPLKALVDEMKEKLGRYFDILPVSGDYRQNKRIIFKTETDGYCMTYEMAYQLMISTRNRPRFFKDIEWIVIDEAHLMTDWGRGPQLESFLYLLQNFCKDARFILLTATVGNPKEFSIHFGCKLVYAMPEERPVKLIKEVKPHRPVSQSEEKIELIETLLHETIQNCPRNKKDCPSLLVFCNSRRLTKELHESLAKKQRYPWIRTDFHHAGRSKEVRNRVEEKFREGDINLLFATPTLAMGVNVPADIVIICGVTRVNPLTWKEEMLEASEIIQMIGRAGRGGALSKLRMQETDPNTGKKTGPQLPYGKAIVACEDSDEPKVRQMIESPVDVRSKIPGKLKYIILTWIKAGIRTETRLLLQYNQIFLPEINENLFYESYKWLLEKHFFKVDEHTGIHTLSHPGKVVAAFAVSPYTVLFQQRIKKKLLIYPKFVHPPTMFCLLFGAKEFVQQVRVNQKFDRKALHNAHQFTDLKVLHDLLGEDGIAEKDIAGCLKAFSLIFQPYLMQRYANSPHHKIYWVPGAEGDIYLLQEMARRMILSSAMLLGEHWRCGRSIRILKKGLQLRIPIFDGDIYDLVQINGCGIKTATLLSEAGICTYTGLLNKNARNIKRETDKIVHHKNMKLREFHTSRRKRYNRWGTLSRKKLEKIQIELLKTGEFSSVDVPQHLLDRKNRRQSSLKEL